jgi:hypothetical protein
MANYSVFPLDYGDSYSGASCDWNRDGYPDLAVSNMSPQPAGLWLSGGGSNNSLTVSLEGVVSNKGGIGAWIKVWVDGTIQVRYTYCGEDYLGQDSQREIFGLDQFDTADSVIVEWPSGHIDSFLNVSANQEFHIVEGSGMYLSISGSQQLELCEGDTLVLDGGDYATHEWSNGFDGRYLSVVGPGTYFVTATSDLGFSVTSNSVSVNMLQMPEYALEAFPVVCAGGNSGSIIISPEDSLAVVLWEFGETDLILDSLSGGDYMFEITGNNGCTQIGFGLVEDPDTLAAIVWNEPVSCFAGLDGTAFIEIFGGWEPYEIDWNGMNPENLPSGNWSFEIVDALGCVLSGSIDILEPDELVAEMIGITCSEGSVSIEIDVNGGNGGYSYLWSTGAESQNLNDAAEADQPFSVLIMDSLGCEVELADLTCPVDVAVIESDDLVLFPNPVTWDVSISGFPGCPAILHLADLQGKELQSFTIGSCEGPYLFNVSDIPSGIYTLVIIWDGGRSVKKLIKL